MKLFLFMAACLSSASAFASASFVGGNPNVHFTDDGGAFPLIAKGRIAQVVVDSADWPGVARAADDLRSDLAKVSGSEVSGDYKILVGTIGHSPLIDRLIAKHLLNVKAVRGKWEASVTQVVDMPGGTKTLVIAGADKRGTIFAMYDISEAIGVSPWYWWADVPIKHHSSAYIGGMYVAKSPTVKYRGIFLNDEAPSLSNWVYQFFGQYRHTFYEKIFELLLRLRANYLWPAMWNNCFSEDDPLNPIEADEYGIVMGTSHVEPMMRADHEWGRLHYTDRDWNYTTHPKELEAFWRDGVLRNKPFENIVTIGMRGKVDTRMSPTTDIPLLESIVDAQRKILGETIDPDVAKIPQLWCLYKEVQDYIEKGMRVPDDVTLLWSDDNWGDIRRLPTLAERNRPGGAGVYYHFDYVGGPRNYKWIDTNPLPKIWEQMNLAHHYGADRIWIVNVGDFKPKAFPIEFFLTMARDPDRIHKEDLDRYTREWATREFGPAHAAQIAKVVEETGRLNGRRKPELVDARTYNLVDYREAERVSDAFTGTLADAERIRKQLPAEYQSAYYELVLHTIEAPTVLNELYVSAAKNALYAQQGRAGAALVAQAVRDSFALDAQVTEEYHHINGGKWNHFMDQTHIGYFTWQQPPRNIMPRVVDPEVRSGAKIGIAVEGSVDSWPGGPGTPNLNFTRFGQPTKRIEVFQRGQDTFSFSVSADAPWIRLNRSSGIADKSKLDVTVDWSKLGSSKGVGRITISGAGTEQVVQVSAWNPGASARGYLEGDGVVAIEAEHTARRVGTKGVKWETIPGYGRTLSGVEPFPVEFKPFEPGLGPRMDYSLTTFSDGKATVDVVVAPSLAFQPGHGLRFALAFDGNQPVILDAASIYLSRDWEKSVSDSVHHVRSEQSLAPGPHTLKIWAIDPGVVIERIVVDLGGLKPSYLGPQESVHLR